MENLSKMTIDDSSTSMYFSFNSTSANKTVEAMESGAEVSCLVEEEEEEAEQNNTLEADEKCGADEQVQTVKKLSFDVSPMKAIPKNILKAYKALSSTPTKAQLLRSVEVTRGSAAVDVCDLGLAFLEAPQECINAVLSEDKENQPQESQEIYSETSSEIVSVIEKTQEEVKPIGKRVGFSNLPVLKGSSGNNNIRYTPKVRRSVQRCEPDLVANRPSRIAPKRMSMSAKGSTQPAKDFSADEIPKMISSILKISKELSTKRKSTGNPEKPFNLLGRATRMSIVKTTLNSPARKLSRKSITTAQVGRNPMQSVVPINKRKSFVPDGLGAPRRSVMPLNARKSMLPTTVTSPKKRTIPMNTRKSMIPEKLKTSTVIPTSRKSMVTQPTPSANLEPLEAHSKLVKAKRPPSGLKEEYVCEFCSRKFRVLSIFEAHKRSHNTGAASTKQTSAGSDKQCRYCDKKFAIPKALSNHLIQNCTKIPPGDKKKLLFPSTSAQLFQTTSQANLKIMQKSSSSLSSSDSFSSNTTQVTHSLLDAKNSDTGDGSMPPPSIHKIKKKLAHSGVYCTPNKEIPCHICKISFSNILAYTQHSLSHSNAVNDDGAASTATESTQTQVEMKTDCTQTLQEDGVAPFN